MSTVFDNVGGMGLAGSSDGKRDLTPLLDAVLGANESMGQGLHFHPFVAVRKIGLLKRTVDMAVSALLLLLLAPLLGLTALLIKLGDRGPVLFWHTRVGLGGQEFAFPKFRSMVVGAEYAQEELRAHNHHRNSITFKMKADPRVTRVGRTLRRWSIDELPQLWCVLKGDMSLVGPRPPLPKEVVKYSTRDRRRLNVTPGLTCIWQVSGRGDLPFERQVELDLEYIERQSLWLDFRLLLKTVPTVLMGRGAY